MSKPKVEVKVEHKAYEGGMEALDKRLENAGVKIGFLKALGIHPYSDNATFAEMAFWNEFGTKTAPPRPFFRQALAENKAKYADTIKKLIKGMLNVEITVEQAQKIIGAMISDDVQNSIIDLKDPEISEVTKELRKKLFGKESSSPLVASGLLNKSVSWQTLDNREVEGVVADKPNLGEP